MIAVDCNDSVRSENWSPGWVIENRAPILTRSNDEPSDAQKVGEKFGLGINLYAIYPCDASADPRAEVESDGARYPQWIY